MEIEPNKNINTLSISKEEFDRLPEHPDNYLFFVYSDLGRDENGEPKLSVALYKGDIPVLSSGTSGGYGAPGKPGKDGEDGENAVLARVSASIGSNLSSPAKVTNLGSIRSAALNFVLPYGPQGAKGNGGGEVLPDISTIDLSPLKGVQGKDGKPGNKGADGLIGPKRKNYYVCLIRYSSSVSNILTFPYKYGNMVFFDHSIKELIININKKNPIRFEEYSDSNYVNTTPIKNGYFSDNALQIKDGTFHKDSCFLTERVNVNNKGEFFYGGGMVENTPTPVFLITPFERKIDAVNENLNAYGVEWDFSQSDSADGTRILSAYLHKSCPVQNAMRGCLMAADGTVNCYLDPTDWSKDTAGNAVALNGSQGNVMIEIPKHYRKCTYNADRSKFSVCLSMFPVYGYKEIPRMYVGAYMGNVYNNVLRSVSGVVPTNSKTLQEFRDAARAINGGDTRWNAMTYEVWKTITWLFCVEYATLNWQKPYNPERTQEGFRQGGFGDSGYDNAQATGETNASGNGTGYFDALLNRFHGVEDLMRMSHQVDGWYTINGKEYVCKDPAHFSNDAEVIRENSEEIVESLISDFDKNIIRVFLGPDADIIPTQVNNDTPGTTFFCDTYQGTSDPLSSTVFVHFLGVNNYNTQRIKSNGLFRSNSNLTTASGVYHGSRLCFIPNNQ